jgi:hypothetical protein
VTITVPALAWVVPLCAVIIVGWCWATAKIVDRYKLRALRWWWHRLMRRAEPDVEQAMAKACSCHDCMRRLLVAD